MAVTVLTIAIPSYANNQQEAAKHFKSAVELVHNHRVREALAEFQQAYTLSPHFAVLYDIGIAHAELGEPVQAVEALQQYLDQGGSKIAAKRRAEVSVKLDELQLQIGQLEVEVNHPDAVITVDGQEQGRSPWHRPMRLVAGVHTISAALPGFLSTDAQVTIVGQQVTRVALALVREPQASPSESPVATSAAEPEPANVAQAQPAAPPVQPALRAGGVTSSEPTPQHSSGTGSFQRAIGITLGAAGVIGLGAGAVFALRSHYKSQDADKQCGAAVGYPKSSDCTPLGASLNSDAIDARRNAQYAFIMGGIGVVAGVTLVLTAPSSNFASDRASHQSDNLKLSLTGVNWEHRW